MALKNKIVINTIALTAANFGIKIVAYIYFVIITRKFTPDEIGLYALLITSYLLMEIAANLGMDKIVIRNMSKFDEKEANSVFFYSLGLKLMLALMTFAIFWFAFRLLFSDVYRTHALEVVIVFASVLPLVVSRTIESYFTSTEQMHIPAVSQIVERLVILSAAGLVALDILSFKGFVVFFLLGSFTRMLLLVSLYPWSNLRRRAGSMHFSQIKALLHESGQLVIVEAIALIYFRIDIFMLSKMMSLESTGMYQVAYKIFDFFIALFAGFLIAIFPAISRKGEQFSMTRYLWLGLVLTGCAAVPVIVFRNEVLSLFQPEYVKAAGALVFLMLTLPLVYWNSMLANYSVAVGKVGVLVRLGVLLVPLNIILNLILIPYFGINGAAASTMLCEIVVGVLFLKVLKGVINFSGSQPTVMEI